MDAAVFVLYFSIIWFRILRVVSVSWPIAFAILPSSTESPIAKRTASMAASASSTEEGRLASPRAVSLFLFCSSICLVLTVCLVCIRHNYGVFILQGFNQDIPEKLLLADPDFAGFHQLQDCKEGDNHMHLARLGFQKVAEAEAAFF